MTKHGRTDKLLIISLWYFKKIEYVHEEGQIQVFALLNKDEVIKNKISKHSYPKNNESI